MTTKKTPHAEDVLFKHVQKVHNLGSVVDSMEEYAQIKTAELESELKLSENTIKHQAERCLKLENENRRLREALERIRDNHHWLSESLSNIAKVALEGLGK